MIRFRCKSCNQKIAARDEYSGKRLRCPKCKNVLVVPAVESANPPPAANDSAEPEVSSKSSDFELSFLDIPQKDETAEQPANSEQVSDKMLEDLQKLEEKLEEDRPEPAEPVGKRKLPWLIDISLYPVSQPGLIILAIIIVIPLLINIVAGLLGPFRIFVAAPGVVINIVIGLYALWYFSECIRDSAAGGVRAPDVMANAPSIGDMFFQTLKVVGCLVIFALPAIIYSIRVKEDNTIYYSLLAGCGFFFPMGLLGVIMFDSFTGLNPLVLIGSIFSTFFQYCGLVIFLFGLGFLYKKTESIFSQVPILAYRQIIDFIYLLMIMGHLLGRFYWRYREKLNWEV